MPAVAWLAKIPPVGVVVGMNRQLLLVVLAVAVAVGLVFLVGRVPQECLECPVVRMARAIHRNRLICLARPANRPLAVQAAVVEASVVDRPYRVARTLQDVVPDGAANSPNRMIWSSRSPRWSAPSNG